MAVDPVDIPIPDAEEIEKREGLFAFMTERVAIDSRLNKNQKKQAAGKTLNYQKCDEFTRSGLDKARKAEWDKWKQFDAGTIIQGQELRNLIQQGHKVIPTQWMEVDKNSHLKQSADYTPEFMSRLVACDNSKTLPNFEQIHPRATWKDSISFWLWQHRRSRDCKVPTFATPTSKGRSWNVLSC